MTFEEAKRSGKLPNIKESTFLAICERCGIEVKDNDLSTRKFNEEELRRLFTNRYIHAASVNSIVKKTHNSVISEYDKMINRYSVLYESIKDSSLSSEDKQGILAIINDLKDAREKYEDVKANISILKDNYGFDETMLNGIERVANSTLNEGIRENDKKLQSEYKELNRLVEEGKKYKTKFKQLSNKAKINRVRKRIESLQAKKGSLSSVQQRIVNKANEKYISLREKEIMKYAKEFERERAYTERRIENNKQIEAYTNDINLSSAEIDRLRDEGGLKNNIQAIGQSIEKRKMESRLKRLQRESRRLDRLKGKSGKCNLSEQFVREANLSHGMAA